MSRNAVAAVRGPIAGREILALHLSDLLQIHLVEKLGLSAPIESQDLIANSVLSETFVHLQGNRDLAGSGNYLSAVNGVHALKETTHPSVMPLRQTLTTATHTAEDHLHVHTKTTLERIDALRRGLPTMTRLAVMESQCQHLLDLGLEVEAEALDTRIPTPTPMMTTTLLELPE